MATAQMKGQMALGLVMAFLLSSIEVGASINTNEFSTNFCLNQPNITKCPSPSTFDLLSLDALGGRWYEIGSNARYKLVKDAGLACKQSNYTVLSSNNFWGPKSSNLTAVDRSVHAIGSIAEFAVTQISDAANGMCQNARQVCDLMSSGSQLDQAITLLTSATNRISFLHPMEGTLLTTARASIGAAMTSINVALDALSKNITHVQYLNSELSQGNGTLKLNLGKLANITTQTGFVQDDIQNAVKTMVDARSKIIGVTAKLALVGGVDMPIKVVPDLGKAVFLVASAEQAILQLAAQVKLALFGVTAVSGLIALDPTKASGYSTSAPMVAFQNSTFPGRLQAKVNGKDTPYLVVAVDGFPNQGYNAALIYSCREVPGGGRYKQELFIISRTATLPQTTIDRFLQVAKFYGIYTDCDDPFLFTVQDSAICKAAPSAPNTPSPPKISP